MRSPRLVGLYYRRATKPSDPIFGAVKLVREIGSQAPPLRDGVGVSRQKILYRNTMEGPRLIRLPAITVAPEFSFKGERIRKNKQNNDKHLGSSDWSACQQCQ